MFHLTIVTPEDTVYERDVKMIVVPGQSGQFGILKDHRPIISKLTIGGIKITREDDSEEMFFLSGGYLEFCDNKATILADLVENIEAIALEQATEARKQAEEHLKTAKDDVTREKILYELRLQTMKEKLANLREYRKQI